MKYIILKREYADELVDVVNRAIEEGWIPQGGVCNTTHSTQWSVAQAMVKYDEVYPGPD